MIRGFGPTITGPPLMTDDVKALGGGIICGITGGILGGIGDAIAGAYEVIQIEGKTDAEVKEIFQELRKKARIRNFQ